MPIIHVRFGSPSGEKLAPAVGWIAIGDRAVGVLFALGGVAAGGISIGGVSTGIISLGGASLGVLSIGGFAVGWLALGGLAIGVLASGGFALGWVAAGGGFAAAREFAMGGLAVARHVNDSEARDFFTHWGWLDPRALASARVQSAFWGISLISFLPAVWQLWRGRKSRM